VCVCLFVLVVACAYGFEHELCLDLKFFAHDGDDEYCPRHSKEKKGRAQAYPPNKMLHSSTCFLIFSFFFFFSSFLWQGGEFFFIFVYSMLEFFFCLFFFLILKINVGFGQNSQIVLFFTYYIIRKRRVSLFLIIRVFFSSFSIFF
jgi:hypothetical protein